MLYDIPSNIHWLYSFNWTEHWTLGSAYLTTQGLASTPTTTHPVLPLTVNSQNWSVKQGWHVCLVLFVLVLSVQWFVEELKQKRNSTCIYLMKDIFIYFLKCLVHLIPCIHIRCSLEQTHCVLLYCRYMREGREVLSLINWRNMYWHWYTKTNILIQINSPVQ